MNQVWNLVFWWVLLLTNVVHWLLYSFFHLSGKLRIFLESCLQSRSFAFSLLSYGEEHCEKLIDILRLIRMVTTIGLLINTTKSRPFLGEPCWASFRCWLTMLLLLFTFTILGTTTLCIKKCYNTQHREIRCRNISNATTAPLVARLTKLLLLL